MDKYFKPKSLTWWGCVVLGILGGVQAAGVDVPSWAYVVVGSLTGVGARGAIAPKG